MFVVGKVERQSSSMFQLEILLPRVLPQWIGSGDNRTNIFKLLFREGNVNCSISRSSKEMLFLKTASPSLYVSHVSPEVHLAGNIMGHIGR